MCGIAGFCSFNTDYTRQAGYWQNILMAMRQAVAHRGPDSAGAYLRPCVGLAHARLAIRDLQLGGQPMVREVDGFEYAIVYNGEIYNTDELAPELRAAGCVLETTSDTEVILYGYIHHGMDFVGRLNGIFAFAIWDGRREQLVLYRDRVGVKPLFYAKAAGTLVFGSEIKALFGHPDLRPAADLDSFREIFGVGPARTPGHGVFRGVREVLPGEYLVFSKKGLRPARYWALCARPHTDSYAETVEKVAYLVEDAVRRQMVSDVPVCSFLSGGLDSSIVTAVAAGYLGERELRLNTFSFDFRDNSRFFAANAFQPEQDRPYVDIMLAEHPLNHTYLECDEERLAALLRDVVDAKDLPGMADIDASLLYFCGLVKRHNKVALTGECADEVFGGYPWFHREALLWADGFPWSHDLQARTAVLSADFVRALELDEYVAARYTESLKGVPRLAGESAEDARRREVTYLNIQWFMQTLLDRMDRASMYAGLEARVPYADHRIIEYVFNVPWAMKFQDGVEKSLLRAACRPLLPERLLLRKKSPYPKTYHPNYERLLAEEFSRIVQNPNAPIMALVDRKKALAFLGEPKRYDKPWFGQLMAGPQMLAYLIQINYWMEKFSLSL